MPRQYPWQATAFDGFHPGIQRTAADTPRVYTDRRSILRNGVAAHGICRGNSHGNLHVEAHGNFQRYPRQSTASFYDMPRYNFKTNSMPHGNTHGSPRRRPQQRPRKRTEKCPRKLTQRRPLAPTAWPGAIRGKAHGEPWCIGRSNEK